MVLSYSVNSVIFPWFYVSCIGLKKKSYYTATTAITGSMRAESVQGLCLIEKSGNTWRTWARHLHVQSCAIPFLFFLPLVSSPSVQSWAISLEQKAPTQSFPNAVAGAVTAHSCEELQSPQMNLCSALCMVSAFVSNYKSRSSLLLILWDFNLCSLKIWLSTSARVFAY